MTQFLEKTEHITLCLFDVLGTSEMTKKKELNRIYSYYLELSQIVVQHGRPIIGARVPVPNPDGTANVARGLVPLNNAFFSDTFIFWTKTHQLNVWKFNEICGEIFCKAIELQIPIRGCISSGEAIMDTESRLFLGEPLVEAASGEKGQRWLGLSYGCSFDDKLHYDLMQYIPYKKQIKKDKDYVKIVMPFAVDWARRWRSTRKENVIDILKLMNKNKDFSDYYNTTIDFFNHSQKYSEWYKETNALLPSSREEYLRDVNIWLDSLSK